MARIIRFPRRRRSIVLEVAVGCGAAVACILILAPMAETPAAAATEAAPATIVGVAGVVDGDGLRIDGARIRLHGVDAFESGQTCGAQACGRASTENLDRLTRGVEVRCEPLDVDRYGRVVARCVARGVDVGAAQVEAGHALAYRRYSLDYVPHEDAARRARRGAWATGFTSPEEWRRRN
ncbi:thermonuclease family protein [Brevundimonas fluminis]|uniref:thermonuclease family protein n=1 Tax=Brevundimonas fluminis TaxID=2487274 RepID=UPI0019D23189|nr:thermonuclease family protein [Brevundimonas fluminis]